MSDITERPSNNFFIIFIHGHLYAKALKQYYDSLEHLSPYKDGGLVAEMRAVTIKALEKFWCITQMPMDICIMNAP
jgi:hypothetical protein